MTEEEAVAYLQESESCRLKCITGQTEHHLMATRYGITIGTALHRYYTAKDVLEKRISPTDVYCPTRSRRT